LYKCSIGISYTILSEGLSAQVIVITVSAGGAAGFALSWFSVDAILVTPVLISVLLLRSVTKQILSQRDYLKFKTMVDKMLDDDKLKETIRTFFMEGEGPTSSSRLKMEPLDFDEKFIKARMKEELGLIENPTKEQLQEIIEKKIEKKYKGKTVFFGDFIDKNPYEGTDFSHPDITDAEIIEESIRMKSDNEF
jgi:hypothetical protein